MLPEVIEHGVNGLLVPPDAAPNEVHHVIRAYCEQLLANPEWAARLGAEARKTIVRRFALGRFVNEWNTIFAEAAEVNWAKLAGEVGRGL